MWVYSRCICSWFLPGPSVTWHTSDFSYVQNKSLLSSLPGATVLWVLFPTFGSSYVLATGTWNAFLLPHLDTEFLGLRMLSYFSHFLLTGCLACQTSLFQEFIYLGYIFGLCFQHQYFQTVIMLPASFSSPGSVSLDLLSSCFNNFTHFHRYSFKITHNTEDLTQCKNQ